MLINVSKQIKKKTYIYTTFHLTAYKYTNNQQNENKNVLVTKQAQICYCTFAFCYNPVFRPYILLLQYACHNILTKVTKERIIKKR